MRYRVWGYLDDDAREDVLAVFDDVVDAIDYAERNGMAIFVEDIDTDTQVWTYTDEYN
jgi:hypothetical protein